jgi:hypothetical protein
MTTMQDDLNEIIYVATKLKDKLSDGQTTLEGKLIIEEGIAIRIVEQVLDRWEAARNSDLVLFKYCEGIYKRMNLPLGSNPYETWRRTRQKFQARGMYVASEETQIRRKAKEKFMRENAKYL